MFEKLMQLLYSFLQVGLFSIGGGYATIPMIQAQVVDQNGWLTVQAFTDIITISQMTPGPLAVNVSTFVGMQIAGIPGAIVATTGCIISGFIISLLLYYLFHRFQHIHYINYLQNGLKSISVGLIAASTMLILFMTFTGKSSYEFTKLTWNTSAIGIFAITFMLFRKWKINPMILMVQGAVLGIILYQ